MRILVVEDDKDQLLLRSMLLERSGFNTMAAPDCGSALQLAALHKPHCAIIDLRLPTEDDGLRLIRNLKNLDTKIQLIVLTGGSTQRLGRLPEASLVDAILQKPFSTALLIERLHLVAAPKSTKS